MSHPFERWPATGRRRALLWVIAAAVAMQVVLTLLDAPLRASDEGGTVAFELAGSPERATEIVDAWRADGVLENAAFVNGLDFLYPLLYAAAIAGACVAAASAFRRRGREGLATLGIAIAWAATAAVAFDWIEDIALAVILLNAPTSPWPQIALAAAIPKFAGVATGLIYAIAGGLAALGRRNHEK
jgi:hypothetical protein